MSQLKDEEDLKHEEDVIRKSVLDPILHDRSHPCFLWLLSELKETQTSYLKELQILEM